MSSAPQRFTSYVSNPSNASTVIKYGIAAAAVVAGGYFVYKAANAIVNPGGQCNDPSSPCGSAMIPLQTELQVCTNQYVSYTKQFVAEDAANNVTYPTLSQQNVLNQWYTCMKDTGNQIASTAKQFAGGLWIDYTIFAFGTIVATGIASILGAKAVNIYNSQKITPNMKTGSAMADAINNTTVSSAIDDGTIDATSASTFSSSAQDYTSTFVADNTAILEDTYTALDIITLDEATAFAEEDTTFMLSDLTTVLDDLAVFGYPPAALAYSPVVARSVDLPLQITRMCGQCF